MKFGKIILGLAAVILVVVVVGVYLLSTNLDPLIKGAIEKYGSQILGAPVSVSGVNISPSTGAGTIRGLRIGNPAGFSKGAAFDLGEITVGIDIASIASPVVVIKEILIAAPQVNVETNSSGHTNFDVIASNAKSHSGGSAPKSKEPEASKPADESAAPLLRILKFTFERGTVAADLSNTGGKQYNAELPELRLNNLGGQGGATPAAIGKEVTDAVTDEISRVLAQRGANELIDRNLEGREAEAAKGLLKGLMK
jgi:uncharacterized protein involved in outer membrane biogenesis